MNTIKLLLLRWLQRSCVHPPDAVKADIIEGIDPEGACQWCEICGSYRFLWRNIQGLWREPRPDYYTPKQRRELSRALGGSK